MSDEEYYKRPEWSYSQMKNIITDGIDYAVAAKRGLLPQPAGKAIDIGQLAHEELLKQGGSNEFVVNPYQNFLTKEARAWKAEQTLPIINEKDFEQLNSICEAVKTHPLYSVLLCGDGIENEKPLFAKVNGVDIRGKADSIRNLENGGYVICDLKTTAQFSEWKYKAYRMCYDLQAANYTALTGNPNLTKFYFFIVETVAPYRTAVMIAGMNFLESGERKLVKCIEDIKTFGDREIDWHNNKTLNDIEELGDFSL